MVPASGAALWASAVHESTVHRYRIDRIVVLLFLRKYLFIIRFYSRFNTGHYLDKFNKTVVPYQFWIRKSDGTKTGLICGIVCKQLLIDMRKYVEHDLQILKKMTILFVED